MKTKYLFFFLVILVFALGNGSCKSTVKKHPAAVRHSHLYGVINQHSNIPFDSNLMLSFYRSWPALGKYHENVSEVYRQHHYNYIWFDKVGIVEFGQTLYSKVKELDVEGVSAKFPYQAKIDGVFDIEKKNTLTQTEIEIMLTNLYLFYAEKVYKGVNEDSTTAIGWLLPRKQVSYAGLLDSVMTDPELLTRNDSVLFIQYYKLRDVLKRYREIEKKGGWNPVDFDPKVKAYKPGDTAYAIRQIRERLFITGDIKENNGSNKYDPELVEAMKKYQKRNGFNPGKLILPKHIKEMNVPIADRIRKIIVNMERWRWISPEFANAKEYININIPAFTLTMFLDGKQEFESPVVVGNNLTRTVIFSGMLSYIVFSPYWNLPQSIIENEVKPGMEKNKHYLEMHKMEWNNGQVRQKPGKNNSLGLVKFIFPNTDDIYMHDSPAKSLFAKESRAFSHGCIRVGKARDMAFLILKDDPNWSKEKINTAMHSGKETTYSLKKKIPVYIGYLTAWVDPQGDINFYDDIYGMDDRLMDLLISEK